MDHIQTVLLGLLTTFVALYELNVLLLLYFKLEHERTRLITMGGMFEFDQLLGS